MVHFEGRRYKDGQVYYNHPYGHKVSPIKALRSILEFELGFGGMVTNVIEKVDTVAIEVTTSVMNCRDIVTVHGLRKDMDIIMKGLSIFLDVAKLTEKMVEKSTFKKLCRMSGSETHAKPLYVTYFADRIKGHDMLKLSLIVAMDVEDDALVKDMLFRIPTNDLIPLFELKLEQPNNDMRDIVEELVLSFA